MSRHSENKNVQCMHILSNISNLVNGHSQLKINQTVPGIVRHNTNNRTNETKKEVVTLWKAKHPAVAVSLFTKHWNRNLRKKLKQNLSYVYSHSNNSQDKILTINNRRQYSSDFFFFLWIINFWTNSIQLNQYNSCIGIQTFG